MSKIHGEVPSNSPQQALHGPTLGLRGEERFAQCALRRQPRRECRVGGKAAHQVGQPGASPARNNLRSRAPSKPTLPSMRLASTGTPDRTASITTCAPPSMRLMCTSARPRAIQRRAAARGSAPSQR